MEMQPTMDISKMAKEKELEYLQFHLVRKLSPNIILINYMAEERLNRQMVTGIKGNSRMTRLKDMEQLRELMETDTSGNTCRVSCTDMEYTDTQMEQYIMDSGKRIRKMITDIQEMLLAQNTLDHGRITHDREMQF